MFIFCFITLYKDVCYISENSGCTFLVFLKIKFTEMETFIICYYSRINADYIRVFKQCVTENMRKLA
jgi:hypothetical protein